MHSFLDVSVVVIIRGYTKTIENKMRLIPEVRELTCCHGDEYQPRTTVVEAVLLGTAWLSSGHGPGLHPCWRSTRGLAIFLHLRMGKSTYLHRKRHIFDSTRVRRFTSVVSCVSDARTQISPQAFCAWCAAEGTYPPFWSLSPQ